MPPPAPTVGLAPEVSRPWLRRAGDGRASAPRGQAAGHGAQVMPLSLGGRPRALPVSGAPPHHGLRSIPGCTVHPRRRTAVTGAGGFPGPPPGSPPGHDGRVIRVLVAEDMRILADTLVAVLNLENDIEVVAEVTDGDAIV